ncbi:ribosome production factor 1 [Apiospora saccharicola]|uniref:Ribosome biogenesis protein YTM1 n=1 Tax=Apiospora saccharicola TaxID=335842 RepID=A0ABR1TIK4_9PEZI
MASSTGAGGEGQQIRVNFTTTLPELQLPEDKSQLLVPGDIKRYGLSRVVNSDAMLNTDSPIPLDFLINGTFLRTSLEDYLRDNGLSFETTVTLQYVRSLVPPIYQASFEHDDWVADVDVLSSTSRAGLWAGNNLPQGQDRVVSASYDGLLRIWNMSGQVIATSASMSSKSFPSTDYVPAIKSAKFLDATRVASAGMDQTVRVWKYKEGADRLSGDLKPTLELLGHKGGIESMDVHTPSSRILTASNTGEIGFWTTSASAAPDAPRKRAAASQPCQEAQGFSSSWRPKGCFVDDECYQHYDDGTPLIVPVLCSGHQHPLLAAGTSARHITLVDPRASATTTSVMTLRGHRNFVTSLSASPNDNYSLVSGSHDGTCRIWDLRSVRTGSKAEGGGSVSEAVYIIERESQKGQKKKSDISGAGCKVFGVAWDKQWGIVSGGEDKKVQINKGSDLLAK